MVNNTTKINTAITPKYDTFFSDEIFFIKIKKNKMTEPNRIKTKLCQFVAQKLPFETKD